MALDKQIAEEIRVIVREELNKYPLCPIQKRNNKKQISIREVLGWVVVGLVSFLTAIAVLRTVYEITKSALP